MRNLFATLSLCIFSSFALAEKVVLVAGGGTEGDGSPAEKAKITQPFGIDFDNDGNLYFVEMTGGEKLRKIDPKGILTTLAGTGKKGSAGDGGPGTKAEFNGMHNLIMSRDFGTIYLADSFANTIRKYDMKTGNVSLMAGTGKKGFAGDGGPGASAEFNTTICIALNVEETRMYVADIGNKKVRVIDMVSGYVATFAGNGKAGVPVDGQPAKDQPLVDPRAVCVDAKGNVYILERGGHALRVVDTKGNIKTVVGTGKAGKGGDGGPGLKASLSGPKYITMDPRDNTVLICDTENHQIRRFDPAKETIDLVAGSGKKGKEGIGGDPKSVELNRPHGVIVHPKTGELFIADSDNNRILKVVR